MMDSTHLAKVGAPDPELKNSAIFDRESGDFLSLDLEQESGVCYFNNLEYAVSQCVCSGNELLCCEERGIWVKEGSCPSD